MDGDDALLRDMVLLAVAALDTEPDGVGMAPVAQAATDKMILRAGLDVAVRPVFDVQTGSLTFEGTSVNVVLILEQLVADGLVRRTPPSIDNSVDDETVTYRVTGSFWEEIIKGIR